MIHHRPFVKKLLFSILLSTLVLMGNGLFAQDGRALFQTNCASCHNPFKEITGPALRGVSERIPDKKLLHDWVHNNQKVLASGNKYFNDLYVKYNKTAMNTFTGLSDTEIDAIIKYVETAPAPGGTKAPEGETPKAPESDN